ncbi:hypothetical protein B0T25DRAFT_562214 [Lasiosphaeria hispida]|uniref:Uncharacterized protein n=1 Tax=Lasiosphaeria hispida TaxID=260671 RepID=A0AAJ0HUK3_9PEZI|nr:hypothetical protein B0T25DRAFT_562214 [Lasiosphaeria hispida]
MLAGIVTVCKNIDFRDCVPWSIDSGRCYDLGNDWNDQITSVRAGDYTRCYIYENKGCTGDRGGPVIADYVHRDLGVWGWNDKTSSFWCETL